MYVWTPPSIKFLRDASEYSDYYEQLAEKIFAYLQQGIRICDAGCGLGYLSLKLAQFSASVTAIDCSEEALEVLSENIHKFDISNISPRFGNIFECPPSTRYDAMVFCFFGNTQESLTIAREQCVGKVILIKKDYYEHRFSIGHHVLDRYSFEKTCNDLDENNIPYQKERFSLQMGQPFHSLEDAVLFFQIYSQDDQPERINEEMIRNRLIKDPSGRYPFYLPSEKRLGLIALDTEDIPDEFIISGKTMDRGNHRRRD